VIHYKYSVVIPVFNSQKSLEELFTRIRWTFNRFELKFEVVFVDDASEDESWEIIKKLKDLFPDEIKAFRLAKNVGQHSTVLCGIGQSSGDFILTMDDDLQNPPEEIIKLIEKQQETKSDLVYGIYSIKKHNWYRNLGSEILKKGTQFFSKKSGKGSSFRLLSQQLALKILNHSQSFVFIDELISWYAPEVSYVEVNHEERKYGDSGYTKVNLFFMAQNLMIYFTFFPLRLIINGGFFVALISFLFGFHYLIKKLFFNVRVEGYTSIIVTILFSTGVIVFSLGIIGEYLLRIYMAQNKKPPYQIRQKLE
jgi:glycosyltransferase involved in cell wall biosynthesis